MKSEFEFAVIVVPPTTIMFVGVEVGGGAALMIIAPLVFALITSPEMVIAEPGVRVWEPKRKFEEESRERV